MPETRRTLLAALAGSPLMTQASGQEQESAQRRAVKAAGFTDEEADCWELCGQLAGAYFRLEQVFASSAQHENDQHEISHAIHEIQNRLLARPTYRRYLETMRGK